MAAVLSIHIALTHHASAISQPSTRTGQMRLTSSDATAQNGVGDKQAPNDQGRDQNAAAHPEPRGVFDRHLRVHRHLGVLVAVGDRPARLAGHGLRRRPL